MNEQETLRQGVLFGKQVMQEQVIAMFEAMKSADPTDAPYSMSNVITIAEAIEVVKRLSK